MKKSFIIGPQFRLTKVPGQAPSPEVIAQLRMVREVSKPAPKFQPAMLLNHTDTVMRPAAVVQGLGFDYAKEQSWGKFLEKALRDDNEVSMRQQLFGRMNEEKLGPTLRRAILQRALSYRRGRLQKSVNVVTVDELRKSRSSPEPQFVLAKADARGGTYHRRVTNPKGKHRYFYDPKKYAQSKGAHVSGEEASHTAIRKGVEMAMEAHPDGCPLSALQPLVKRYGSKVVGHVLNEDVTKAKKMRYKGGKLVKSDRFVLSGA